MNCIADPTEKDLPGHDPSKRFILPASSPLAANLAALWATEPKLAELVEATLDLDPYSLESSKSGPPTVSVSDHGKRVYVHSRYEPVKEAQSLIEAVNAQKMTCFYLLGLG